VKVTHPYTLIKRRIDVVARVPAWAVGEINKGDLVIRLDAQTVFLRDKGRYKVGESYTEFWGYTGENA
jgi:hypothetical protein